MEYWDLYTKERIKLDKIHLRDGSQRISPGEYHIVVNAWIINDQNQLLISQRHSKKTYPLKWECTGGSILAGEDSLNGALREVWEEIGIKLKGENGKLIDSITRKDDIKDIFLFRENVDINETVLQPNEVINIKWVTMKEFDEMVKKDEIAEPILYDMEKLKGILNWK
jgi:isopentenyldiphosphate isomerase